jgi:two-component system sensor histidine kinase ChiS
VKKYRVNENREATILIADDNTRTLDAYRSFLELYGHRIITEEDGLKAVGRAIQEKPDVIILDVNMPGLNGYEAARRLTSDPATNTTPIVIISGRTEVSDRVQALKVGAVDYLTKPVNAKELKARIDSLIRLKDYNDSMIGYQNQLKTVLAAKHKELQASLEAYSRFVPKEFLSLLGNENITEVKAGDQCLKDIAILFSDIRLFTALSEKMTPQENFNFLNSYLKRMDPFIWNNNGFIDKYIGDSIMALFPQGEESALNAAIQMILYLPIYNNQRQSFNYQPINIGIGLHSGTVMLGTIGNERFMQGTVISSNVNLASRLEELTKVYDVQIITSSSIIFGLKDPTRYNHRFIDKIKVRGMSEPISVFEVFDGDPEEKKEQKRKTQSGFEKAVYAFHRHDIESAYKMFQDIRDERIIDSCIEIYCQRCEQLLDYRTKKERKPHKTREDRSAVNRKKGP